jgi:hypothetical protein
VLRVNGVEVLNLAHLKQLIQGRRGSKGTAVEPSADAGSPVAAAAAAGAPSSSSSASSSSGSDSDDPSSSVVSSSNGSSSAPAADGSSSSSEWDDKFIRLELEDDRLIIMERAAADEASERLQRRYRVPYHCSADLADA